MEIWRRLAETRLESVTPEPFLSTSDVAGMFATLGIESRRRRQQLVGFLLVDGKKVLPLHYVHHRQALPGHAADRLRSVLRLDYDEYDALLYRRMTRAEYIELARARIADAEPGATALRASTATP